MNREEAIKVLNSRPYTGEVREALETLIPELKESEDERIRKFFAELATDACGGPGQEYYEELGLNYDKVMGWLEKQKDHFRDDTKMVEQKPAEWDELQSEFKNINEAFEDGKKEVIAYPEKYGLCKPAEWSEEKEMAYQKEISYFPKIKKVWSEEDELTIADLINFFEGDSLKCSTEEIVQRIKSLHPQSKIHYWTEEEIEPIISDYLTGKEHYGGMIARLRCLKPKSSWKPSEEELVALKNAGGILRDYGYGKLAKMVFIIEGKLANLAVLNKSIWKPSEGQMKALNSIILTGSFTYVGQTQDLISLKDELKKL